MGKGKKGFQVTHGMTDSREYVAWLNMRARCYNPNYTNFEKWGGRGITVCDRWRESFEAFYEDMGPCTDGFTLERIEVDCNYDPDNCKWASRTVQANNKSNNQVVEYQGRSQTIAQWAQELGMKYITLYQRLLVYKWSTEKAMTTRVSASSIVRSSHG